MEREIRGARVWGKTLDEAEWEQMERGGEERKESEETPRREGSEEAVDCNYTIGVGKMGKIPVGLFN